MKEDGKKLFIRGYDEKLKTTIVYKTLKRKVLCWRLTCLECYKLVKHLMDAKQYAEGSKHEG
ncbi:MAG: hypothetical protein NWF14_08005 [Candidatus Bathyarchaeota archaeon]|nr:hypothetical protein [Candidatus Bathyarchaeota archaeon]